MSGVAGLVSSGPLLLAIPVAAAAGAVTFLSPCVLPLVPGYLSYITGMSGAVIDLEPATDGADVTGESDVTGGDLGPGRARGAGVLLAAQRSAPARIRPGRRRAMLGTALFVLGFSALFATYGVAFGGLGAALLHHQTGLTRILGALLIVLGLLFAGAFDRFSFAGRILRPSVRPRAGLASAPVLGVLFGLGWSPCIGPTLAAVLTLASTTGTAARGALLAFIYGLGIGVPFLIVAFAFERGVAVFGFARRHAAMITRIGGLLLVGVGVLEVSGAWTTALAWLQTHWIDGYNSPF
jgi:cytochrome c-type biogenesis protein